MQAVEGDLRGLGGILAVGMRTRFAFILGSRVKKIARRFSTFEGALAAFRTPLIGEGG